jgi:hypothetical protein
MVAATAEADIMAADMEGTTTTGQAIIMTIDQVTKTKIACPRRAVGMARYYVLARHKVPVSGPARDANCAWMCSSR